MSRLHALPVAALALFAGQPAWAQQDSPSAGSDYGPSLGPAPPANECPPASEADPDVIVVCRQWEDGSRYTFERPARRPLGREVRDTADGAPRAPDFDESCLHNRGRENCIMLGSAPPPAIMVDFDALPETPEGSEAARLYGGPTDADGAADEGGGI